MFGLVAATCFFLAFPVLAANEGAACMEDCLKLDEPSWEAALPSIRKAIYGTEASRVRRSVDYPLLDGHHVQKREADLTNSSCGDLLRSLCWTSCKNNPMQTVARQRMDIHLKYCNPSESQNDLDDFWRDFDAVADDLRAFNSVCARHAYLTHAKDQTTSYCSANTRCLLNALDYVKQKYATTDAIILLASSTKLQHSVYFNRETPQTCPELYEPYQP